MRVHCNSMRETVSAIRYYSSAMLVSLSTMLSFECSMRVYNKTQLLPAQSAGAVFFFAMTNLSFILK